MNRSRKTLKVVAVAAATAILATAASPALGSSSKAQIPKGDFFGCERINSRLWTCGLFEDSSRKTRVAGSTRCVLRIRTRGERVVSTRVVCGNPAYAG